jgi:hypothetical protein
MKQLKIPAIEEYPETVFQALKRLADFPDDIVTVQNLHREILGHNIFPEDGEGDSWVKSELREGMYIRYVGEKGDPTALAWKDGIQWQIKKPLAAMIVADVIRRSMKVEKSSF